MSLKDDLEVVAEQERVLRFGSFNADTAWELGGLMRAEGGGRARPVAIGIWMAGQTMLFCATTTAEGGVTRANEDWLRRKRNTVERFGKSSMRVGMEMERDGTTMEQRQGLTLADYAAHGGGFPLVLEGTGCVGAVVVSGLTQREDHDLVVMSISALLGRRVEMLGGVGS